jgi:hypothetical protein
VITGVATSLSMAIVIGLVVAVTSGLTTYAPEHKWVWRFTAGLPLFSLAYLTAALAWGVSVGISWSIPELHSLTFAVAVLLGVTATVGIAAGPLSVGAMVIATFVGATMGTAVGLTVDAILGTDELLANGAGWVAVSAALFVLGLVLVCVVLALRAKTELEEGQRSHLGSGTRIQKLTRRVTLGARVIFVAAGVLGLGFFAFGVVIVLRNGLDPRALGWNTSGWIVWASIALVLGPMGLFAGRSVIKGRSSGVEAADKRRQVGILWDLGSFWPRWFHPLAPPGYGPAAVKYLAETIDQLPEGSIVGAHSQGSLIAAAAWGTNNRNLHLITYGSQLGILYPRMFPEVGIPDLVERVSRLCTTWTNLWRDSDPIGGQVISVGGIANVHVEEGVGHSGYEQTDTYDSLKHRLLGPTTPEPWDSIPAKEPDSKRTGD